MSFMQDVYSIRNSAIANHGSYIPYSQCLEPTKTLIESLPYTSNGICQALSAKWIAEHANGGSLFNWLCEKGTTVVKPAAIVNLMINFTESVQKTGPLANKSKDIDIKAQSSGLFYQDFITEKYLGLYGVRRRGSILANSTVGSMGSQLSGGTNGYKLASRFQPSWMNTKGEAYVLVSIMGKGGHALAGYIAGSEVALFDPNFGEFYFSKFNHFYKWFVYFYDRSGYSAQFPSYYLLGFGKDATGKWKKYK